MFKKAVFSLITLQFFAAFLHSLSFLSRPVGTNDTEKQLIQLLTSYKQEMGLGISRSTFDVYTGLSTCFCFLCILGGWINLYFLKNNLHALLWKGLLRIQSIVFGAVLVSMVVFTFLPYMVIMGLIVVAAGTAYYTSDMAIPKPD